MEFQKYQHIERFGTDEVENIELGTVYLFSKIDGTSGSVWKDGENICAGSRRRQLTLEDDNAGFYDYILYKNENIHKFLEKYPQHRLFGEWLVKHSLQTYREDAWRKFYIFDVAIEKENINHENEFYLQYLPYTEYQPLLEEFNLDYIPPLAIITNGTYDKFVSYLEQNVFLIEDGKGAGEGIILKNWGYRNKYGRQTWAKIVRSEFKEKHAKIMGAPEMLGKQMIEDIAVTEFCTVALIDKTYHKIITECDGWSSKYIPRLLETVYYDLITEEIWHILKKYKYPTINFTTLRYFVISKIKEIKKELF